MSEKTNAVPGDYVEIHLTKLIYEGVLLEVPEDEKRIVLLKLDSGYNIGFNKKDILKIVVLKKEKEKKPVGFEIKQNPERKNIAVVITGGTIAARLNPKKGGVDWLTSPEDLFKFYPELFEKVNVSRVEIPFMKASEDMDFKDWQKIAKVVVNLLNDTSIQGVIITHGTDFLHYTSAALSFFIKNLNKPVVLTYSQRSIDRASSDANLNLQCAALVAISDIAEVSLVGHASSNDDYCFAIKGCNVLKLNTSKRDTFRPINDLPMAKIYPDRIEKISDYRIRNKNKAKLDADFEEKVALLKVYPGQDPSILDYYLKNKYKGIILEMSGLGHAPTMRARKGWTKKLKEVQEKGLIVCAVSQCIYGRVDPLVYSNGRELLKTGIIYLEEMLSNTALIKLGWILGHKEWAKNKEKIKEIMLKDFCGEINKRILSETFLY